LKKEYVGATLTQSFHEMSKSHTESVGRVH